MYVSVKRSHHIHVFIQSIAMSSKDQLKIYICGPHSTGKMTLLHNLEPYLGGVKVIEEVARGIIKDHGWKRDDFHPDTNPDVFQQLNMEILQKQIEVDLNMSEQGIIILRTSISEKGSSNISLT